MASVKLDIKQNNNKILWRVKQVKRLFLIVLFGSFSILKASEDISLQNVKSTLEQWNSAISIHNSKALWSIYSKKLKYYGKIASKKAVIKDKKRFFRKYPNFWQYIENDHIYKINKNTYRVVFDKYVKITLNSDIKKYPSHLTIKRFGNGFRVVEEGDKVTDRNLRLKNFKKDYISKNNLILDSYKASLYAKGLAKVYVKKTENKMMPM